jgi:hypothetical protein
LIRTIPRLADRRLSSLYAYPGDFQRPGDPQSRAL